MLACGMVLNGGLQLSLEECEVTGRPRAPTNYKLTVRNILRQSNFPECSPLFDLQQLVTWTISVVTNLKDCYPSGQSS